MILPRVKVMGTEGGKAVEEGQWFGIAARNK